MSNTARSSSAAAYTKYEIRHRDPNPASAALLVIDVQRHFAGVAAPILPALSRSVALCRDAGIPVLFTRHRHRSPADYGMLVEWWPGDLILDGTPAAELLPDLGRLPGDPVVEKSTYSAFAGTGLEEKLREMGVEEVIVTGVMTDLCCETTAREAFVRGFRVFFSEDATATSNRELHEATLMNMAYGFAYLVNCKKLEAAFGISLGKNANENDADEIIEMASKGSVKDQQKQVQENIHVQIKSMCMLMEEILYPDQKIANIEPISSPNSENDPKRSGLSFAFRKGAVSTN